MQKDLGYRPRFGLVLERGYHIMNNQLNPKEYFGCYILRSLSCVDHCYIGFTVDPRRRLDQHNGLVEGGAKKTTKKRPWEMVLTVYGFPSQVAALRFEYCWQNPNISLLTRDAILAVPQAQKQKDRLPAKIRTLYEILQLPPFNRFPLTIYWMLRDQQKFSTLCVGCPPVPRQMVVLNAANVGVVDGGTPFDGIYLYRMHEWLQPTKRLLPRSSDDDEDDLEAAALASMCDHCLKELPELWKEEHAECIHDFCSFRCHVSCMASIFLQGKEGELIPTIATCPLCKNQLRWGDVVLFRQKRRIRVLERLDITT